jgi:N-acetylneuraminic acid mutarotase
MNFYCIRFSILFLLIIGHINYIFAQNITPGDWVKIEDSTHPRVEAISVKFNEKIYIFSGFTAFIPGDDENEQQLLITSSSEVFDPALINSEEGPWKELAPIPIAVTHSTGIIFENEIWISGGFAGNSPGNSIDKIQIYDVNNDTWKESPILPEPMASHGMVRVGNQLHVIGGLKPDRITDNDAHYYFDLTNQEQGWQVAAVLPKARNHFGIATLKGKIYIIGGQHGHDEGWEDLPYVHAYDPLTNTWEECADLPSNRSHFEPGTFAIDGKIIIVGGRNQDDNNVLNDIIEYDPEKNFWSETDTLPIRILAPVAKIINNQIIVSHGGYTWKEPYNSAYIKDYVKEYEDVLKFWPENLQAELSQGSEESLDALLFTYNKGVDYIINTANIPDWIQIDEAQRISFTDPQSKFINIKIDTEKLEPGDYSYTLTASAEGFADAELSLNITVVQTDEPVEPVDPITNINDPRLIYPSMKLFPNPNDGKNINLELLGLNAQELILVKCIDALGKIVFEKAGSTDNEGKLYFEIQNSLQLKPGIYIITASHNKETLTGRLLIR